MARLSLLIIAIALLLCAPGHARADAPPRIPIQGFLTDADGLPIDGTVTLDLTLYGEADAVLHHENQSVVVDDGAFSTLIGDTTSLDLSLFRDHTTLTLGVIVNNGPELTPRVDVATVPFAAHAQNAASIDGLFPADLARAGDLPWTDLQGIPADLADGDHDTLATLSCASGQLPVSDGNNAWTCGDDQFNDYTIGDGLLEVAGALSVDRPNLNASYVNHNEPGSITGAMIVGASIDSTHLSNDVIQSQHIQDGDIALVDVDQPAFDARYRSIVVDNSDSGGNVPLTNLCTNFTGQNITITVPGPGKVLVQATTHVKLRHVTGTIDLLAVSIGDSPNDCGTAQSRALHEIPSNHPTSPGPAGGNPYFGHLDVTLNPTRLFEVPSAGTYTFYVNGLMVYGHNGDDLFWFNSTFATYIPD